MGVKTILLALCLTNVALLAQDQSEFFGNMENNEIEASYVDPINELSRFEDDFYSVAATTESTDEDVHSHQPKAYAPPVNVSELVTASCPCKAILVSSLSEAQHIQYASMGVFKLYSSYNGKPAYRGPNGQRLYFLNQSGWLIGPTLGSGSGFIHNPNNYLCPYLIPAGWMYVNTGYWYNDTSLVVRCIPQ